MRLNKMAIGRMEANTSSGRREPPINTVLGVLGGVVGAAALGYGAYKGYQAYNAHENLQMGLGNRPNPFVESAKRQAAEREAAKPIQMESMQDYEIHVDTNPSVSRSRKSETAENYPSVPKIEPIATYPVKQPRLQYRGTGYPSRKN
jgi:hypothetical protein